MGIIDPNQGTVSNPFKREPLDWLDILKPVYNSLLGEGVYDPKQGYTVSLSSAINEQLIDAGSESYQNPITGERLSLMDAAKQGLIDEETVRIITKPSIDNPRGGGQVTEHFQPR